jgi:ectopic P granules protein 5
LKFFQLNKELNNVVDPVKEEIWILVDSDGEEGNDTETGQCVGLKENDLVNLINQIPLEQLFRILVQAELKADNYSIDRGTITGHHLLVALAFGTNFVELLGQGLLTYNTERYKQFAKRLGRLIKHIVFYLTELKEIWQHNLEGVAYVDPQTVGRINIEYDSFVMRATYFIYKSQKLGAWQYLMGFPFAELRIQTVWKLYYCLHVGYGADFVDNVDEGEREIV